jgi:hypothetical protein
LEVVAGLVDHPKSAGKGKVVLLKWPLVIGLIVLTGLVTAANLMRIRGTTTETSTPGTKAVSASDHRSSWEKLYDEAPIVAQVRVLRVAGSEGRSLMAEVRPLAIFKSDNMPVRYIMDRIDPNVFCGSSILRVGETFVIFAKRLPRSGSDVIAPLRPVGRSGTIVSGGHPEIEQILQRLSAWSSVPADTTHSELIASDPGASSSCAPG